MSRMKPSRGNRRAEGKRAELGETLVEFAFAAVIFFALVLGILEFGIAIWNYNLVSNLAQDGARFAIVRGSAASSACSGPNFTAPCEATSADVESYVKSRAVNLDVSATATWPDGSNAAGKVVAVEVSHTLSVGGGLIPYWNFPVTSTARMVISR